MTEWHQELPPSAAVSPKHTLWVPMLVEALVCGKDVTNAAENSFIDLTPRYDEIGDKDKLLGHVLKPDLGAGGGLVDEFVKPGIHLHWTLPAAFRHVRPPTNQNEKNRSLLLAPNRWFVTRIWRKSTDEPPQLSQTSWIVESDFRNEDGSTEDGAPWLDQAGESYNPTRLGRVIPLDRWAEPGTVLRQGMTPLTAIAPANPAFASHYPSCRSVFGLYDDVDGLEDETECTYLVAGWFSRESEDPLFGVENKDAWIARMHEFGWELSKKTASLPTRTVCYATIRDVKWTQNPPGDGSVDCKVALGSGLFEAIAAMSKKQSPNMSLVKRLQNQLQLVALRARRPSGSDLKEPTSIDNLFADMSQFPSLKARLHGRAFSASPGGTAWEIARKESPALPKDRNAEPIVDLPPEIATDLYQINLCQRRHDELERELAGARRNLYGGWYQLKYYRSSVSGWGSDPDKPKLEEVLSGQMSEAYQHLSGSDERTIHAQLRSCGTQLAVIKARLESSLAASERFKDHALLKRDMPRFWRPNDPFVLLSGVPVREMQGGRSPLMCRVSDQKIPHFFQKVTGLEYPDIRIEREGEKELRVSASRQNLCPSGQTVPPDVTELLLDLLFSHRVASGLLARVFIDKQFSNPSDDQYKTARIAIEHAQRKIEVAADKAWKGHFDYNEADSELPVECGGGSSKLPLWSFLSALNVASTESSPVFSPVFMVWNAEWHPYYRRASSSGGVEQQDLQQEISAAWDLESGGCDLIWKQDVKQDKLLEPAKYEGFTIVARRLERGLEATKQQFPIYNPIFENLKDLAGQSLSGLTEALGMLDSGPQVRPPAQDDTGILRGVRLKEAIGAQYGVAPLVEKVSDTENSFFPIRGGHLRLTRLWLADTFGRIRRIIDDERNPDVSFGYGLKSSYSQLAHFPPRLVQPSRLLFRWVSANDKQKESVADLQTSPICGWIKYNRLDRSFLVYRADGLVLGAVSGGNPNDREGVRWSKLPQRPRQEAGPNIENIHLRGFVEGLMNPLALTTLRDLLHRIEHWSGPSPEQGLQSIIGGAPLALVRASLRLAIDGPPITDQSRSYLLLPDSARGDRPSFMNVAFSVRIGDRRFGPDGVIGYFVDSGNAPSYAKMRLSADQRPSNSEAEQSYLEFDSPVNVTCTRPDDPPLGLTLLMDPRLGVHIISGILPVNEVVLPPPLVSTAMAALQLHFLVAPVFGEWDSKAEVQAAPILPLPTGGQNEWTWTSINTCGNVGEALLSSDSGGGGSALFAPRALYEGWLRYNGMKGQANDR